MNQEKLAREIFAVIGPAENIQQVQNCMTRLRLYLVKQDTAMLSALKKLDGVLGLHENGDELQIVLGPGRAAAVAKIISGLCLPAPADAKETITTAAAKAKVGNGQELHAAIRKKNATPAKLFFKRIAGIFLPLIPAFIACGLISGIINIVLKLHPALAGMPILQLGSVMGSAVFWGMNLFVGINTAKEFGGSPVLGGTLAAFLTHPALAQITLNETPLMPGRGGIIAVLLVAALGAWLEKQLRQRIPEMFDLFLPPLLVLLLAGTAAVFILQPLGGVISESISQATTTAISRGGALTGFILGGIWLPMVMLGLHQALTPIHAELLLHDGINVLLPILAMAGGGQVGASLAVYCKTKNTLLKKTIISALPVALIGIGEPLIYGVTLPLGRPFLAACIGGACGGAVQAFAAVGATTMGMSGLPLAAVTNQLPVYLLGLMVAYLTGFIAAWLLRFDDPVEE